MAVFSCCKRVFHLTKIAVGIKIRQRTDEKCRKDQNEIDLKYDRANL